MNWLRYEDLPPSPSPFFREWFALRFDAPDFRANLSSLDIDRIMSKAPGDWRYAKGEEVYPLLRAPAAKDENTEQLRKLQEALAAKQSVIDRIHEWSAPNRI
jgi:hypothetical protein